MNIQHNQHLQHKLAAEFVLGTLRGGARRRFNTWLQTDPHLQQIVREWQAHLMPMMEFSTAKVPQAQVWNNIEKQLKLGAERSQKAVFQFLHELKFWRGLSMIASAALILVALFVLKPQDNGLPAEMYVATLSDEKAQPIAIISSDSKRRQVLLRFVNRPQVASNQSLELWSISKEGKVRSLGLVDQASNVGNGANTTDKSGEILRINLPEGVANDTPQLLAISLEPKGGSGNPEKPSGPILFKGNWLKTV
ncbi:anti-sigma factor [Undibacterium danionis]|uniref:Anti-sigma factor domain-containing protein n=1 Tax=Undibacterium danionis TaxID=1812100 RepID=A0ABV6IJE0_9BURK